MAVADTTTQLLVERTNSSDKESLDKTTSASNNYDPIRTLRWATIGLTLHGPYFFFSFRKLDGVFGASTTMANVVKKTATAQLMIFPPYLVSLFTYMGVMESGIENVDIITSKVKRHVPEAFIGGCIFWPIANFLNFSFVSTGARVPYLAAVGGIWNGYLSWMNAKKD